MKIIVIGFLILFAQMVVGENTYNGVRGIGNASAAELKSICAYIGNDATKAERFAKDLQQYGLLDDFAKDGKLLDNYKAIRSNDYSGFKSIAGDVKGSYPKYHGFFNDALKKEFFKKFGKELPSDWAKFSPERNIEFADKLKNFKGNGDLTFNPNLSGGEGQLFTSPLANDKVLKRWYATRVKDMPESIQLLVDAKTLVESSPTLNNLIEVVTVGERGSDWVVRGFRVGSFELKSVIESTPLAAQTRQAAINALSNQSGTMAQKILNKLNRNSANLHWSTTNNKILIIDMQ